MNNGVLVIGAVLLDVIGRSSNNTDASEDKIGRVAFSVGGVAFNIAVNLRELGFESQLFTCLKANSPISDLLKSSISDAGVKLDYIIEREDVPDATFMAIHHDNGMRALTSSPIENVDIQVSGTLRKAISRARIVIVDTNLSADQIKIIHGICVEHGSELCIVSASDSKAARIAQAQSDLGRFSLVGMNAREAERFGLAPNAEHDSQEVRKALNADQVLLSKGPAGATFFDINGRHQIPAPSNPVVDDIGAGDALFAAICACHLRKKPPYKTDGLAIVTDAVSQVLGKEGPNMGQSGVTITDNSINEITTGATLLVLAIASLSAGLGFGPTSISIHWPLTLGAAAIWGSLGTWLYNKFQSDSKKQAHLMTGAILAVVTVFASSIPNLISNGLIDANNLDALDMRAHFITSQILAALTGAGLSHAYEKLFSRAL